MYLYNHSELLTIISVEWQAPLINTFNGRLEVFYRTADDFTPRLIAVSAPTRIECEAKVSVKLMKLDIEMLNASYDVPSPVSPPEKPIDDTDEIPF